MKNWKEFNDECTGCGGSDIRVLTDAPDGFAKEGDSAECLECGLTGVVDVDFGDETDGQTAYVLWNDGY